MAEKSVCQIGEIFIATSVYNLSVFSVGRVLTVQLLYILQKITVLRFCLVTPELNGSDIIINRNSYKNTNNRILPLDTVNVSFKSTERWTHRGVKDILEAYKMFRDFRNKEEFSLKILDRVSF